MLIGGAGLVRFQGTFEAHELLYDIAIKEILAAIRVLRLSGLHDAFVTLYCDNANVVSALNNFHSKSALMRSFVEVVVDYQITLTCAS